MKPTNRIESILEDIANGRECVLEPENKKEYWLKKIAKRLAGGGSGGGVEQIVFSVDYDNEFQVNLIDKTYEDAKRLIDNMLPFVTSAVLYNDGTAHVHRCDTVFLIDDDEKYFKFEFTGWASFSVKLYEDDRLEYEAGGNG